MCISKYKVGQKTGLFLRSDNFATTDDRKACNISKVSEFCLEWSAWLRQRIFNCTDMQIMHFILDKILKLLTYFWPTLYICMCNCCKYSCLLIKPTLQKQGNYAMAVFLCLFVCLSVANAYWSATGVTDAPMLLGQLLLLEAVQVAVAYQCRPSVLIGHWCDWRTIWAA